MANEVVKKLVVQGFRRVEGEVELELPSLTALYGPNASGKSSILCALQRLLHYVYGVQDTCSQELNYSARTLRVAGLVWVPGGYVDVEYGADRVTRRRWFRVGPLVAESFKDSMYVKCGDRKVPISFAPYISEGPLLSRDAVRNEGLLGDVLKECDRSLSWLRDAVVKLVEVDKGVYEEFGLSPLRHMAEALVRYVRPPAAVDAVSRAWLGWRSTGSAPWLSSRRTWAMSSAKKWWT